MIREAARDLESARVLDDGCGIGAYVEHLRPLAREVWGLDFEAERVREAARRLGSERLVVGAGEALPFADASLDLVLSNEVIEHVRDDRLAVAEIVRVLRPGGRAVIFCPNRWYPVEQHGIYWRGRYRFGNIPLVNYLPDPLRDRLAPHVRTYTRRRLFGLLDGLPVEVVAHRRIYGGYDNLVARFGAPGRVLRAAVQRAEGSPLQVLGLSHLLVVERIRVVRAS
jgi:SAM-dependent methyltransferase